MVEDRGEDVVVWMTGTWICNGTGCSLRQGYAARTRLLDAADATLLQGSEIEGAPDGRASYLLVPRAARLGAATAARALHRAGLLRRPLVRPSEDEAGPWWDAGPVFSGRDTIRCPHPDHADRHPSCLAVMPPDGRGGAKCYACDRRFALRIRGGKLVAREAREAGSSLHNKTGTITGPQGPPGTADRPPPVLEPPRLGPGIVVRTPGRMPRQCSANWLRSWRAAVLMAERDPGHPFGAVETVCVQAPIRIVPAPWGGGTAIEWVPHQVTRALLDLDDLLEDHEPHPGIAQALRKARHRALEDPEVLDFVAVATSTTGVQVHIMLATPSMTGSVQVAAWWSDEERRDWLRDWGRWWLQALGRGGHLDESQWHSRGQCRRPAGRQLPGGRWWLPMPADDDETGLGGYWGTLLDRRVERIEERRANPSPRKRTRKPNLYARARMAERVCAKVFGSHAWMPARNPRAVRIYFRDESWVDLWENGPAWSDQVDERRRQTVGLMLDEMWGKLKSRRCPAEDVDQLVHKMSGKPWAGGDARRSYLSSRPGDHVSVQLDSGLVMVGRGVSKRDAQRAYQTASAWYVRRDADINAAQ